MLEYTYNGALEELFTILDRIYRSEDPEAVLPGHSLCRQYWRSRPLETALSGGEPQTKGPMTEHAGSTGPAPSQPDLFGDYPEAAPNKVPPSGAPRSFPMTASTAIIFGKIPDIPAARKLYELSANAYERVIHGWMSELPIEAALIRFSWKILAAGMNAPGGYRSSEARKRAEMAAADRGDPDVQRVLTAAYRVWKELDRLRGLLRFSPAPSGIHIARCTPDHFVLPGLADHFTLRFGETSWGIIDERRALALVRSDGEAARLIPREALPQAFAESWAALPGHGVPGTGDPWEDLWRNYHRAVNNETRSNPQLQRQFMPKRYWNYLPELREQ